MNIKEYIMEKGRLAKEAARKISVLDTNVKNNALLKMADSIIENKELILEANKKDMENGKNKNLSNSLLDRLLLNEKRIEGMAESLRKIASLPDPIGEVIKMWKTPNNLQIGQIRVPIGVIGIIYEARPNVTVDAAALCIKSGNAVILRGGSEAINSNTALASILSEAAFKAGLPQGSIQLIETTNREAVNLMMKSNDYIDVLIPRGGAELIKTVLNNSTVPVIQTGVGNCHIYVDAESELDIAKKIIINAKTQRPAVCNAIETVLIHRKIAATFLPDLIQELISLGVTIKGCPLVQSIVTNVNPATEEDWATEYLDLILAVKVVESLDEAICHISKYGTKHSEAIVTNNYFNAQKFLNEVDASVVYVNASTRFTDGEQFGFGGEIGISTQKIHARGPMGLNELTTTKYIVYGNGQIRE